MDLERLRTHIRSSGLRRVEEQILGLVRPCLLLNLSAGDELPVGSTKIGGSPDLPEGLAWPTWGGTPLAFVAQVNCAELRDSSIAGELPPLGLLAFFYDAEQSTWGIGLDEVGSWRTHFIEAVEASPLERRALPEELPDHGRYREWCVEFEESLTLPGWETQQVSSLGLKPREKDLYFELTEEVTGEGPRHKILGHPEKGQGDMQLDCQLAAHGVYLESPEAYTSSRARELAPGSTDWRLLLQIDSEERVRMKGEPWERIYFWIRENDLVHRNFESTWMIHQSG